MTKTEAFELLQQYNKEEFHLEHGRIVSFVMGWFSKELGYADEAEYWEVVGMLHDLDFELYPDEHCVKSQEMMAQHGVDPLIIRATASHGWGLSGANIEPEHTMEKVLYATDELTGLIGAAALMRSSKSTLDMELKSLKKKYKNEKFAAGCSREVIANGAAMLGWELDTLLEKTLAAMQDYERAANV